MAQGSIYALLVGIDKYQPPVPALDGCVNDMRAIRDFLQRRAAENGTPLHLEVLENAQATRLQVVKRFEDHLSQAGPEDTAFFYFSGHGSQERAHEIFIPIEGDGKNETLVCYDSRMPDGMDLADKEIATLLDLVAAKGAHVVVITDCCNSGGNTRDLSEVKNRSVEQDWRQEIGPGGEIVRETRAPMRLRSLDSYILPRNTTATRSLADAGDMATIVPNPRHVHMAAAHSFQLAKETWLGGSPRGVFTYTLLEVLNKAVGPLTYNDLMRQVQQIVTRRTFEQNPQIHAPVLEDLDRNFLGGAVTRRKQYYTLSHDRDQGWVIDAGAVHGMVMGTPAQATLLSVFAEDATQAELEDLDMALGKVSVREVQPERSLVTAEGGLFLDTHTVYRARIFAMAVKPLRIHLRGTEDHALNLLRIAIGNSQEASQLLALVDRPAESDYKVIANDARNWYQIVRQADEDDRALVEQVSGFTPDAAAALINQLIHIAHWERVMDLENPSSSLFSQAIRVEIYPREGNRPLLPDGDGLAFRYRAADGTDGLPRFRVKLVNNSGQRLYCSLLHLSSAFAVDPGWLANMGLWLEPGQEQWVRDGKALRAQVADEAFALGHREVTENLKVLFSTREFSPNLFKQPALGQPRTRSAEALPGNTRSIMFDDAATTGQADWNANTVALRIIRED